MQQESEPIKPHVLILGTRGIPASHGGFETFAERLALHLVQRGWSVTVYCQHEIAIEEDQIPVENDYWEDVRRININTKFSGPLASIIFDLKSVLHASRESGSALVLGYNTAIFTLLFRLWGKKFAMNMDGIEWKRRKWPFAAKVWLYINEKFGVFLATTLVADHPKIFERLVKFRNAADVVMIPYGADLITEGCVDTLDRFGLRPHQYLIQIGRIEPENGVLEMIRAFGVRNLGIKYVCLGNLVESNAYHRAVRQAASENVLFPGAIFDPNVVRSLRFFALAHCHGHTVGGTNPSLVEALGAGNAIIAHSNPFNRWVAGRDQFYFSDEKECAEIYAKLVVDPKLVELAGQKSREQHLWGFTWAPHLKSYEDLLFDLNR